MRWISAIIFAIALALLTMPVAYPATTDLDVDVALVLAVDISDSVDNDEYTLQQVGLAEAFLDPALIAAVKGGSLGRIAVMVIAFSSDAIVTVPWVVISDAKSAQFMSDAILVTPRPEVIGGSTSISAGLTHAALMINASAFRATRRVIDISGDGTNNYDDLPRGIDMDSARALVKASKITVNGLPIRNDEEDVPGYYRDYVISGPGSFAIPAENSKDFGRAIRRKLILEIS